MSMSGSAIELPISTDATPEEKISSRQLKRQLRLQDAKTKMSSPWASGIAIILAILWTIPTFGLFVTSFRPPADIADSGWWTFFANPGITFENYTNAWSNSAGGLGGFFVNSFVIVFPAVLIPIALALLAAYCFAWRKIANLDGIDAFILHRHVDNATEGGLNLGLWRRDPNSTAQPSGKRPIYEVFRLADTPQWQKAFEFALPIIGIKSWEEIERRN